MSFRKGHIVFGWMLALSWIDRASQALNQKRELEIKMGYISTKIKKAPCLQFSGSGCLLLCFLGCLGGSQLRMWHEMLKSEEAKACAV